MSPSNGKNERDLLKAQTRFQRNHIVGQYLCIVLLISLLAFVIFRERIAVVPPVVQRPYQIGANYASKDYLLDMSYYALSTLLNVNPENVDFNNKIILKMTHPDGAAELKTNLDAAALRMKKERISTTWAPRKEEVNERALTVNITGLLKTYIADKPTSDREKTYTVQFAITNSGRSHVYKIEEVDKNSPARKSGEHAASERAPAG